MRTSKNSFNNLALFMIGFGVVIGIVFPFASMVVGVERSVALSPGFFLFSVVAGFVVGGMNILLARLLLRPKLTMMAEHMREVEAGLTAATYTGDWSRCDPEECAIPIDSEDEFAMAASAFNQLLVALMASHNVESRLAEFTDAMSAELDVESTCEAAIEYFRTDLGADGVAILGGTEGDLRVLSSHGIDQPENLVDADLVTWAMRSLEPDWMYLPPHLVIDSAVATMTPERVNVFPLVVRGEATGAVVAASSAQLPPGARALGPLFARTLAVALANALSHESIQLAASIDPLLEILNRRAGLAFLREQVTQAAGPVAALMIDLDHFKAINDTHGHLVGDEVLQSVVRSVQSVLRGDDTLVRYGGEEMLVVLPGASGQEAARIAERIRSVVAESSVLVDGAGVEVTVSIGVAATSDPGVVDEVGLIAAADAALYAAKRSGRNATSRSAA